MGETQVADGRSAEIAAKVNKGVAVRVRSLTKTFPGVLALDSVDLDIAHGEIHGLVGENGAGKSTLIKHIAGVYAPDSGEIEVMERRLAHADPRAQQRAGVAVIYQERLIVPELSAAANVFLGRPKKWGPFVSERACRKRFRELAENLGASIESRRRAGSLSVANQQLIEIMRALEADHRILIMDEPTASLGARERQKLYGIIRGLKEQGLCIIFISHDLEEVLSLCDRVSVMRDGQLVATRPVAQWSKEDAVAAMLGDAELKQPVERRGVAGEEVLRVEELRIPGTIEGLSFSVKSGEILGIAGLIGSGRSEILRALAGADPEAQGRLYLDGRERPWPTRVTRALDYGIALAPEDRKEQGLVLGLDGAANVTLAKLAATATYGFVSERKQLSHAEDIMSDLGFDVRRLKAPAETLSGGNQQKLVVGKWLYREPKVLLLDEPTRGIDVGAKAEMFSVITRLANRGMAVIFVSSELEEIVNLTDRTMVIGAGRSLHTLDRADVSVGRILDILFSVRVSA